MFIGVPTDGDVAWHSRHLVELRRGASAAIVEHHRGVGSHAHLGNSLMHVHLGNAATLTHARIQDESPRGTLLARTDAVLARDATYGRVDLELGAAGLWFGAGPHACPGRQLAETIADAIVGAIDAAKTTLDTDAIEIDADDRPAAVWLHLAG